MLLELLASTAILYPQQSCHVYPNYQVLAIVDYQDRAVDFYGYNEHSTWYTGSIHGTRLPNSAASIEFRCPASTPDNRDIISVPHHNNPHGELY